MMKRKKGLLCLLLLAAIIIMQCIPISAEMSEPEILFPVSEAEIYDDTVNFAVSVPTAFKSLIFSVDGDIIESFADGAPDRYDTEFNLESCTFGKHIFTVTMITDNNSTEVSNTFYTYKNKSETKVQKITYLNQGEECDAGAGINAGAEAIKVYFTGGFSEGSLNCDTVRIVANDRNLSTASVHYDAAEYSITAMLAEPLPGDSEGKFIISRNAAFDDEVQLGRDFEVPFTTGALENAGDFYIKGYGN